MSLEVQRTACCRPRDRNRTFGYYPVLMLLLMMTMLKKWLLVAACDEFVHQDLHDIDLLLSFVVTEQTRSLVVRASLL